MRRYLLVFVFGMLAPLVALIALGLAGLLPVRATARPPRFEAAIADRALMARIARDARGLKSPVRADEATLLAGLKSYRQDCAGCHGTAARPSTWGARNFYPRVPQFAQGGADMSDAEMFVVVKYGIRYTGMAGWEGMASDEEIWRMVTFLSHLRTLPPAVAGAWRVQP